MIIVGVVAVGGIVAGIVMSGGEDGPPGDEPTTAGEVGVLRASSSGLEMGDSPTGEEATAEFEIFNEGPGSVDVEDVRVDGEDSFAVSDEFGTLEPSEECLVEVTFAADELGESTTTGVVEHTGQNSPLTVDVRGAVVSVVQLRRASSVIARPAVINFDQESLYFDTGGVPESFIVEEYAEVENSGPVGVKVLEVQGPGGNLADEPLCRDTARTRRDMSRHGSLPRERTRPTCGKTERRAYRDSLPTRDPRLGPSS